MNFENTKIVTIDSERRIILDDATAVSDSGIAGVGKLDNFFQKIKLINQNQEAGKDKSAKIGQILSYLEVIHTQIRKYSKKHAP